jgi:ATP adenylyltransferase
MDNLWAPWRAPYIRTFDKEKKSKTCLFCRALKAYQQGRKSQVIEVRKLSFSILNIFPYNNGHLMILPKRHVGELSGLKPAELLDMMTLLQDTEQVLRKVLRPHAFNVGLNLGRVAGAGITEHLHFHIVPRWAGDTNFMPLFGGAKVISESLGSLRTRLTDVIQTRDRRARK